MNYASHSTWDLRHNPTKQQWKTIGNSDEFLKSRTSEYTCRKYGGTASLASCGKRKGDPVFHECADCPGPVNANGQVEAVKPIPKTLRIFNRIPDQLRKESTRKRESKRTLSPFPPRVDVVCPKCGIPRSVNAISAYYNGIWAPEGHKWLPLKKGLTGWCRTCSNGATVANRASVKARTEKPKKDAILDRVTGTVTLPCAVCGTVRELKARTAYQDGLWAPEGWRKRKLKHPGRGCSQCTEGRKKAGAVKGHRTQSLMAAQKRLEKGPVES